MFCFESLVPDTAIALTKEVVTLPPKRLMRWCNGKTVRQAAMLAGALGLALFAQPGTAFAHAHLQRATPAADSTVAGSPAALTLRFTEAVEPRFSTVELRDGAGTQVDIAKPVAHDGGLTLSTPLPRLQPGAYTVIWHATSVDTHKTEGKFTFTVSP